MELNYKYFSVEDFVWDTGFRQWALSPDIASNKYWNEFVNVNPHVKETILSAKQIVRSVQVKNVPISDDEVEFAIQLVLNKIEVTPQADNKDYPFKARHLFFAASVLAAICLMAWGAIKITANHTDSMYNKQVNASTENLIEKLNATSHIMPVTLSDGSKVMLGSNARISFPVSFSNLRKRKIYLSGEAFFEVAKDPSKPFFVYANGLVTKVLGTRFKIRAYANERVAIVEVTSGVVSVFSFVNNAAQDEDKSKKLATLILTRNQRASYSRPDRTLTASIVNNPQMIDSNKTNYNFSATSISSVFKLIEQQYGIAVVYDNNSLLSRTFSADLGSTTLFQKLNIICKTINARYEIIDGKIMIYNK